MNVGKLGKPKYLILVVLTPILIGLDQWSKLLVLNRFHLGESIPVLSGLFNLTYVRNTGAAFGIMAQAAPSIRVPFFLVIPVLAMAAIIWVFRKIPAENVQLSGALSMVVGGAIGNMIDRLRLGFVVDFLDFHWNYRAHFPAFNLADSVICVGVGVLILDLILYEERQHRGTVSDAP